MKPPAQHAHLRAVPDGISALIEELEEHMQGYGATLLGDRSLPGSGNVDRIAIGAGGVTLIDVRSHSGPARIRDGRLYAGGGDRTSVVDRLLAQRKEIERLLDLEGEGSLRVKAALCWPEVEGSARFGSLMLKGVRIDGPRGIARLARRSGELPPEGVAVLAGLLDRALD